MSSVPAGAIKQVTTVVLSGAVLAASLAGLVVAILNLQRKDIDCTVRSLSTAYIIFFVISVLAMFGAGGAVFRGTDLGATAGLTILSFASFAMFVIAAFLTFYAKNIRDEGLRNTNYAVFGVFAALSLVNAVYLFSQRRSLITSQPATQALNYVQNRFARGAGIGGGDFTTGAVRA